MLCSDLEVLRLAVESLAVCISMYCMGTKVSMQAISLKSIHE